MGDPSLEQKPARPLGKPAEPNSLEGVPAKVLDRVLALNKVLYALLFANNVFLSRYDVVYYNMIHLPVKKIGVIRSICPLFALAGQIFWAAVCDRGLVTHTGCIALATCMYLCFLSGAWSHTAFHVVFFFMACASFTNSQMPVLDTLTWKVLHCKTAGGSEDAAGAEKSYGRQRLFGSLGLAVFAFVTGVATQEYGVAALFGCSASLCVGVLVACSLLPSMRQWNAPEKQAKPKLRLRRLKRFVTIEHAWFFLNLIVYGVLMSLVEVFLFVFILSDFDYVDRRLIGATVFVMGLSELPAFWVAQKLIQRIGLFHVFSVCHLILVAKLLAYSLVPHDNPLWILCIEPLHGVTFAWMWAATVEWSARMATKDIETTLQAVSNGMYFRVGQGLGAFFWGQVWASMGARHCFRVGALLTLAWCPVFYGGLLVIAARKGKRVGELGAHASPHNASPHVAFAPEPDIAQSPPLERLASPLLQPAATEGGWAALGGGPAALKRTWSAQFLFSYLSGQPDYLAPETDPRFPDGHPAFASHNDLQALAGRDLERDLDQDFDVKGAPLVADVRL